MRVVGTSKMPWPLSIEEIGAVKRVVELGCKVKPHSFLTVGSQVCIEECLLAGGLKGVVKAEKNRLDWGAFFSSRLQRLETP